VRLVSAARTASRETVSTETKAVVDGCLLNTSDNQCGDFKFAAADGFDGTLQGYYTLPADM
jgi:hypothetical protein